MTNRLKPTGNFLVKRKPETTSGPKGFIPVADKALPDQPWELWRPTFDGGPSTKKAMQAARANENVLDRLNTLLKDKNIITAEPEVVFEAEPPTVGVPIEFDLPPGSDLWHLKRIRAPEAWSIITDELNEIPGTGVVIGHLDTGVVPSHPVIAAMGDRLRFEDGWNFVDGNSEPIDPLEGLASNPGHGTGTLGVLAAHLDNGKQGGKDRHYFGVAPGASVVPVRISPRVWHIRTTTMAAGLQHAISAGCSIVTISQGGIPSQLWAERVDACYAAGIVVVAAAGNHLRLLSARVPPTGVIYPARFPKAFAVSGILDDDRPYREHIEFGFSGNDGPEVLCAAPTVGVLWARPRQINGGVVGGWDPRGCGTSTSTPQVAGSVALWLHRHRDALKELRGSWRVVEAARLALQESSVRISGNPVPDSLFGYGRLDALTLLNTPPRPNNIVEDARPSDVTGALGELLSKEVGRPGPFVPVAKVQASKDHKSAVLKLWQNELG